MSGMVPEWTSSYAIGLSNERRYYVAKFPDKIRKRPVLVKAENSTHSIVASFRDEKEARAFCQEVLGGVKWADSTQG